MAILEMLVLEANGDTGNGGSQWHSPFFLVGVGCGRDLGRGWGEKAKCAMCNLPHGESISLR